MAGKPGEDKMSQSEAARAGTRGSAGISGGGGGGGGGLSGGRLYKDPDLGGLATSWGAPVHTNMEGPGKGVQTAQNPGSWSNTKDQVNNYNNAARQWNNDVVMNNVLGFALPFGLRNVAPRYDQPATYSGGTYHFGMNPAAAAAGVAGMFAGPAGIVAGPIAGKGYNMFGGKDLVFSGPDVPSGWRGGTDPSGGTPPSNSTTGGNPGGPGPGGDRTSAPGAAPPISGNPVATAPGGAQFGPQPSTPTMTTGGNPAPGMFRPRLPNHSLPRGFQSAFPNSLSEEDKALLYANALRTA